LSLNELTMIEPYNVKRYMSISEKLENR